MIDLKLIRKIFTDRSTKGELYFSSVFECYTLEDVVRPSGEKIAGKTAISAGKYRVIIDKSTRFKRLMPLLLNVPDFEGVRIHSGNTDQDTEGCILVGRKFGPADYIEESKVAFNSLFDKLKEAYDKGEEIWIEIVDEKKEVKVDNGIHGVVVESNRHASSGLSSCIDAIVKILAAITRRWWKI